MSKICFLTSKKSIFGNNVSHSNRKTRRKFFPNLHYHKIWIEAKNKFVHLRLSKKGLKTIEKYGLDDCLLKLKKSL